MKDEVLEAFAGQKIKVFFDGTLGAGGHAEAILQAHPEIETYIACDRDPNALFLASNYLSKFADKVAYVHGNFVDVDRILESLGIEQVDGFFLT